MRGTVMPLDDGRVHFFRFPRPYRAMLAICSDLDETPDRRVYWEIMRFLNTTQTTAMGEGLGLEVGNTLYFDMPPDQFAYWNTDDAGREMVRGLIRSGHIDCLHSFGDLATTRTHAGRALEELARHDCRLAVWVDHGTAVTNFGADIMGGHGDEVGHPAYHADLTCDFGVRYVWRGRVTSVIGQDVPRCLGGLFNAAHPVASAKTLVKEWAKGVLARRGHAKYAMHGPNALVRDARLRDGREVREFIRCNPHWGGVSRGDTGAGLDQVLTDRFLQRLVDRGGTCILYTHLGKVRNRWEPVEAPARRALQRLADYYHAGRILVTTTRRLLDYRSRLQSSLDVGPPADGRYARAEDVSSGSARGEAVGSRAGRNGKGNGARVTSTAGSAAPDARMLPPRFGAASGVAVDEAPSWPKLVFPDFR
jgi:hypothetical protein